jgi:hypothetical protein
MRFVIALVLLGLAACGGGSASSDEGSQTTPGPSNAPVAAAEEEETGGTAQQGDDCDYGGAERFTCRGGLVCCYPEEGEVAYGTCTASCPGYD